MTHVRVRWLNQMCDMTQLGAWHDSCTYDMTQSDVWHDSTRCVGWSIKLQVSFAEYRLFYRTLLQKRPIILRPMCDMTHADGWDDSNRRVTRVIRTFRNSHKTRACVKIGCVAWLNQLSDMTQSDVWHDWIKYVIWLMYVWHDQIRCVPWLN